MNLENLKNKIFKSNVTSLFHVNSKFKLVQLRFWTRELNNDDYISCNRAENWQNYFPTNVEKSSVENNSPKLHF